MLRDVLFLPLLPFPSVAREDDFSKRRKSKVTHSMLMDHSLSVHMLLHIFNKGGSFLIVGFLQMHSFHINNLQKSFLSPFPLLLNHRMNNLSLA